MSNLPISPYKAGPNPQPMEGEVRKDEDGNLIGPAPFFQVGDRVQSRFPQAATGTVDRVFADHKTGEWLEYVDVTIDLPFRRDREWSRSRSLAQHFDLVSR